MAYFEPRVYRTINDRSLQVRYKEVLLYQDTLTALADATTDMSMSCHEQRTAAATGDKSIMDVKKKAQCLLRHCSYFCTIQILWHRAVTPLLLLRVLLWMALLYS